MRFGGFNRLIRVGVAMVAAMALLGQTNRPEEELRAALILGFARFSEWPAATAGAPKDNPMVIGVVQQPGISAALERAVAGKTVNGRPVVVRTVKAGGPTAGCHILYFGRMPAARLAEVLRDAPAAALTVGEDDHFLATGGAVHLFEEDGRISFEVSLKAMQTAGVTISSKLLRLGYTVREPAARRATP